MSEPEKSKVFRLHFDFTTLQFTCRDYAFYSSERKRICFDHGPGLNGMKEERLHTFEFNTSHPTKLSAQMYTTEERLDKRKEHFLRCCFGVIRRQRRIREKQQIAAKEALYRNKTFAIIKPDAVKQGVELLILDKMAGHGFRILQAEERKLMDEEVGWLYREHADKPWLKDQLDFMQSGIVNVLLVESDNETTVNDLRRLIGSTDSSKADPGTIRYKWGNHQVMRENVIHASDSKETAQKEIEYFFTSRRK